MARRRGRVERPKLERHRLGQWSRVALLVSSAALTFALARIQILASDEYALIAKENRVRPIVVPAPRGTIYDRYGQVVAENTVGYQVLLMPAPLDSMLAQLGRLRPVLGLTDREVALALARYRREPHLPMQVTANASPGGVARLQERRFLFPGVLIHQYPRRHYPAGAAVAHLAGYVAEISSAELELPEFAGYRQGRWIGKAGIERSYEKVVGGEPGVRYLEVDALGRIKRWLPEEAGLPPIPGRDLTLYLDLDLQRYVMEIFPKGMRGAFVALDPQTGGVLALYSTPTFDPNLFVGGIDPEIWQRLNDDPGKPLLDRATGASQPPGSTFKLATASMAMDLGLLKPGDVMPIPCTGGMRYERRYARCWYGRGHGRLNLVGAIKNSCNVYFYQVGIRIGLKRFLEQGSRIGIAGPTGIDLPGEIGSTFPTSTDDWQRRFGYKPYNNEIMSLAIGQGMVTLSPLRLAQLYVAVARRDGRAPVPRLAQLAEPPPIGLDLGIPPEGITAFRQGLRRVLGPGGTAHLSRLPGWDFMGKTGTAQNPHGPSHAWFVGVGGPMGGEPEIVAVMMLEHGEHGYTASGYVANAVNFFLSRKYGMPFERYPTPRDRLKHDLPVDWAWLFSDVEDPPAARP